MRYWDIFLLTQQSIKSNRLRSNITVAIITIGIFALISIITIIQILEQNITNSFSSLGSNSFTIQSEGIRTSGRHSRGKKRSSSNPAISYQQAMQFVKNYDFPSLVSVSILASNGATVKTKNKTSNPNINILAVDEQYLKIAETSLDAGKNFNKADLSRNENVCLIGSGIAKNYFGNAIRAVNKKLFVGNTPYRVCGVLEKTGSSFIDRTDNQVFITLNNARQYFDLGDRSYVISVKVKDIKYLRLAKDAAIGQMRIVKKQKINEAENFSIVSSDELANMLLKNISFVTTTTGAIGFITLIGAAIGLMNIMLVAVAERTREIGLAKAIGARDSIIRLQFLSESVYISIKGGILGILAGIAMGNLFSLLLESPFIIPWKWTFLGLFTCLLVGLLSGIYPALKAARLNPITALRFE